jgi:hypothetical protein
MRQRKVIAALDAVGTVGGDIDALLPHAYGDTPELLWPLAARSLMSHLIKLKNEGRASCQDSCWRATQTAPDDANCG